MFYIDKPKHGQIIPRWKENLLEIDILFEYLKNISILRIYG